MKIEDYGFGRIRIDGRDFSKDVMILPERIICPWWRLEGHYLQLEDLKDVLETRPEVLVIGTGYFGRMRVAKEVEEELTGLGIRYHILRSKEAVRLFNDLDTGRKAGIFHLTC